MSQKSSFDRLFVILDRLNRGQVLCTEQIAEEFEINERTVYRDFKLIKETWGDFMTKEGKCYKAYKKDLLGDILRGTELSMLSTAVSIIDSGKFKTKIDKDVAGLIKKSKSVYLFKTKPFESIKNPNIMSTVEKAILFRQKAKIKYRTFGKVTEFNVNAYKIVFMNENFYLAGEVDKPNPYILLRISMIEKIELSRDTFIIKPKLNLFINNIQTPFAEFKVDTEDIHVITTVTPDILKYFENKKFLPSQKICNTLENGSTIITFDISCMKEFMSTAIQWAPKMKILKPDKLRGKLKKELLNKLQGL